MTKNIFVENIKPGSAVDSLFAALDKAVAAKKDGSSYLNLTLADRTGSLKAVAWDNVDKMIPAFENGDYVRVQGQAGTYRDQVQITVRGISRVPENEVNPADFLPACPTDPAKLFRKLLELTATIQTPCLAKLMEAFWSDEDFVRAFLAAPAGKKMHHAYVGGLLEHTLSVALLVDPLAVHYIKSKGVDRDLLLTGAVLHDIGKVDDFQLKASIDYSDTGRLVGHIITGIRRMDQKISQIPDFPEETALLLRHMIVSHHGEREFGALEPPKTLEAVMLNIIDDLDAKVNGIRSFMDQDESNASWTAFHRLLGRHFYRGGNGADNG